MITRAQAEALLTLAESLEACERLNLEFSPDYEGLMLLTHQDTGNSIALIGSMASSNLRATLAELLK